MRCPYCHEDDDKVVDSRAAATGHAIRRRRECLRCGRRFTTYERVETMPLRVVKKDGSRSAFERQRVLSGMVKACEKRPVPTHLIEEAVTEIEAEIFRLNEKEIPSSLIGELVMARLKHIDKVAFVRFASVYREFKDVSDFLTEVRPMLGPEDQRSKKA